MRPCALAGGVIAIALAVLPPLANAADRLFAAHMMQHLIVIAIAAPLLVIAAGSARRDLPCCGRCPGRRERGSCSWLSSFSGTGPRSSAGRRPAKPDVCSKRRRSFSRPPFLRVPVSKNYPGGTASGLNPDLQNAHAKDHNRLYGSSPGNIHLDIVQGRGAMGMPAFGAMLPDQAVWDLVAYVKSMSQKPPATFGKTTSLAPQSPSIEQVPAGQIQTATPWNYTEPMPKAGGKPPG